MIRGIINIGKKIRLKKTITIGLVAILVSEMVFNTAYADLNKRSKLVSAGSFCIVRRMSVSISFVVCCLCILRWAILD